MQEFKDNPRELMRALDRFLSVYFGDRQVEYRPNLDETDAWNLPQPLKDIYSFISKFQGQHGFLDSNQDSLLEINILNGDLSIATSNEKLG